MLVADRVPDRPILRLLGGLGVGAPVQVVAGTERRALRVEQDHTDVGVPLGSVDRSAEFVAQLRRDRVVALGSAECESSHVSVRLDADGLGHAASSRGLRRPANGSWRTVSSMRGGASAWRRWLAAPWSEPALVVALVLAAAAPVMLVGSADVWLAAGQDDVAARAVADESLARNGVDVVVETSFGAESAARADRAVRDELDDIKALASADRTIYTLPGLLTLGPPPLRQVGPLGELVARAGALDAVDVVDQLADTTGGVWITTWFAERHDLSLGDPIAFEAGAIVDEEWNDLVQGGGASQIFPIVGLYEPLWNPDRQPDSFWLDAPPQVVPQFIEAFDGPNFELVLAEEDTVLGSGLTGVLHWRAPMTALPDDFDGVDALDRRIQRFATSLVGPGELGAAMLGVATTAGRRPILTTEFPATASTVRRAARRLDGPLEAARAVGGLIGLLAALAVGVFFVERRRAEFRLLASEGEGAVRMTVRVAVQLAPLFAVGGAVGVFGALAGPAWYGPADGSDIGRLPWWPMSIVLAAALLLASTAAGSVGVRTLRNANPGARSSLGRAAVAVLVLATIGAWVQVGRTEALVDGGVDLIVIVLPVAAILLAVIALLAVVAGMLERGRMLFGRAPTELFLAVRLLARGSTGVRLAAGSLGLGIGLVVFAAAFTSTLDRTVDVKLSTEVGGATWVSIIDDLPPEFDPPAPTTLIRTSDTTITPGDVPTRVIAIDPATFADAVNWSEQFGADIDEVVAAVSVTGGDEIAAVAVSGEPTPGVGAFGITRAVQYRLVDRIGAFPLAGDRLTSMLTSAASIDELAARSNGYPSVDAAREVGFPLPVESFRRVLVSQASAAELIAELDAVGVRYREVTSLVDRRGDPATLATRSAFGYLGVIGVVALAGSLVALTLFLAARRRLRALTSVMTRSMGLSAARAALVSAVELAIVLSIAVIAAFAAVPVVVRRLSTRFDPAPNRPPDVAVLVSWSSLIALTAAATLAVCVGVWWLELRAGRRPAGEVLRDGG